MPFLRAAVGCSTFPDILFFKTRRLFSVIRSNPICQSSNTSMRCVFVVSVLIVLAGCSTVSSGLETPPGNPYLSKQRAIDIVLDISRTPRIQELAIPTNIQADLIPYGKAIERVKDTNVAIQPGYSPYSMVWLVTLEGTWTAGSPCCPTVEPFPPAHHFAVLLDAKTGQELGSSLTQ